MKSVIGANSGVEYELLEEIASNVHGKVFRTQYVNYAVKILNKKDSQNTLQLKKQISYINTRNIKDLSVSIPIEHIEGDPLGYVMEMVPGMMPLEKLINPAKNDNWWYATGGLKKRLAILRNLAHALSELQNRGLVYGDLSPQNILVSESAEQAEIYLIEIGNITHLSKVGSAAYTPGYGAPEVVKGISGLDTFNDAFSFSILAYQLLTLNHPFIGDYVKNGNAELLKEALAGNLPWINHTTDEKNKIVEGCPYMVIVPQSMKVQFKKTFEDNLHNKLQRTTLLTWKDTIEKSLDLLLYCHQCNSHFNHKAYREPVCPFCNARKYFAGMVSIASFQFIIVKEMEKEYEEYSISFSEEPAASMDIERHIIEPGQSIIIREKDLYVNGSMEELYEIIIHEDNFVLKGRTWQSISICDERTLKINKDININNGSLIEYGELFLFNSCEDNSYQRVIRIRRLFS